jgi:hypothetical protein
VEDIEVDSDPGQPDPPTGLARVARSGGDPDPADAAAAAGGGTQRQFAKDPAHAADKPTTASGADKPTTAGAADKPTTAGAAVGAEESTAEADRMAGRPTAYAGLLFLLASAADAGLPGLLIDDPRLARCALTRCLHAVGRLLAPVAADDPALLALSGQLEAEKLDDAEPDSPEGHAIGEAAESWRWATVRRMREYGGADVDDVDDRALLDRVLARPGRVICDPGWVEVLLDVADIDVLIRRAGLDLDPGWVPWLGAVVRYRYE